MKGQLVSLSVNPETRRQCVTIELDGDFGEQYNKFHGKPVDVTIKPYLRKRSLDANAYAWVLLDKLAAEMGIPKEEIYREAIRQIGGVSVQICLQSKAVDAFCKGWESRGIGWQCEKFPSKIAGCINVIAFFGSSVYDTKQMSGLINQLIEDCRSLGIETKSPEEIASLLKEWGE